MADSGPRSTPDASVLREGLAVAVLFAAVVTVITWPLALQPRTWLGAPFGPGDPFLNLWVLGWDLEVLTTAPADFFSGRVFDAPIFHPARQALAFSDHQLLQALLVWPVYWLTRNPVVAYNVVWLVSLWASGVTMWRYLREVTGHRAGALAGGLAFAFSAYRLSHVVHLQLQALYFLPLAALAVHRIVARRRLRDGAALGLWFGLTAVSSAYYAVIGGVGLAVLLAVLVAGAGRSRLARLARPLVVAALVTACLVVPVAVPYVQSQQREGFGRNLDEASRHAATAMAYASAPPWRPAPLTPVAPSEELALHPGWGVLLLTALAAASLASRRRRPHVWAWLAVVAAGLVLSFGPDGWRTLYAWCHRWLFGFHAVRAPARFGLLVTFGTAALAAYGAAWAWTRSSRWRAIAIAGLVLVGVEAVWWRLPVTPAPAIETPVNRWLRDADGAGAVAYLPMPPDREATPLMLDTLVHRRPIVNGYSGQRPAVAGAVEGALASFPSAEAIWMLSDLEVRFVVTPQGGLESSWPLARRASLAGRDGAPAVIYEVADATLLEQALGRVADVVAPAPGTPAFAAGERSTYEVYWDGAGTQVPAGTATIAIDVADPADSALPSWITAAQRTSLAWRIRLTVETAPWVARFFEARDTFTTWTDGELVPVAHVREIREGRRRVDQSVAFERDPSSTIILPPDATTLEAGPRVRTPPLSRDPLAALLLLRTLPLAAGDDVRVPVVDMGRVLTLQTGAASAETLTWRGRDVETLRYEPSLVQRIPRRTPPDIDVWLARELGWRPVRAVVEAGFGRVRMELASHEPGMVKDGT